MVMCPTETAEPQLPRFYAGREVLITGASGFMGKVLVERLLSTCPAVQRLHLLVRDKQGQPSNKRLAQLKSSQVFDNIRAHCPRQLDKLVVVSGDITKPQLGLDDNAIAELTQVSVMFHNAATIKFWEPLRDAVHQNVLSAIHVMDLCDKLPALEALVHVSTAYTNADLRHGHIEERVYEMGVKLPDLLDLLDTSSTDTLQQLILKLIHPKPNTYVFTKALAEVAVAQRKHRDYSVTIFRPSIVISSHRAPFPGWIEGLSGPTGVVVALGQGVMRVFNFNMDCRADLLPVDVAIDNMLAVAWETATDKAVEARVYYCGSQENPLLWRQFREELHRSNACHPMDNALYYPFLIGLHIRGINAITPGCTGCYKLTFRDRIHSVSRPCHSGRAGPYVPKHGSPTNIKYVYKVVEVLLQTVPLYVAEYLSRICGRKQRISFITIAKRLSAMSDLLCDFSCRDFTFSTDNMRRLRDRLHSTDGHLFHLDVRVVNWQEQILNFHRGARKYILRQKDENLPRAKKHMNRLRLIHYMVQACLALFFYKFFVFITQKLAWFS